MKLFQMGGEDPGPGIEVLGHDVKNVVDVDQYVVVFMHLLLWTFVGQFIVGLMQLREMLDKLVQLFSCSLVQLVHPLQTAGYCFVDCCCLSVELRRTYREISQFVRIGNCDISLLVFQTLDALRETHRIPIFPKLLQFVGRKGQKIAEQMRDGEFWSSDQYLKVLLKFLAAFLVVIFCLFGQGDQFGYLHGGTFTA